MKQILQNMGSGETTIVTAPAPQQKTEHLIIETSVSLISAGTERMLVGFGKANLIDKVRQQPDKVKMVLEKIQTDGLMTTIDAVRSKLAQPLPLGYSNVGVIKSIGQGVTGFKEGQRVVSNGAHADVVRVPKNLCAIIPDNVTDEEAAFTVVASIALQGIRLAKPTLGEAFVVTGVGLIGLLAVQLLRAQGCRVLAIDFEQSKLELAKTFGAEICNPSKGEDPVAAGMALSRGKGVDGVIITASTKSSEPVIQGAHMCRKRGRIVLVGVTGLELNRADFYEKELSFQVSCSYGPGRYDSDYEEGGKDYPIAFVRWTEQRNFTAILDLMANGMLNVKPLITNEFDFDDAIKAYDILVQEQSALGILLKYKDADESLHQTRVNLLDERSQKEPQEFTQNNKAKKNSEEVNKAVIGVIGAGNYASRILIPAFKQAEASLHTVVTSGGINGVTHGKKMGFTEAATDVDEMLNNAKINTVAVVTQHNSHAELVVKSLNAGKHVFVEKPLALTHDELSSIEAAYKAQRAKNSQTKLLVGFNRRFAPQVQKMKTLLESVKEPKSFIMTMNAGAIPKEHWIQNSEIGGGRIIGEACHYIDLMRHLVGHEIISSHAHCMGDTDNVDVTEDKAVIVLGFADGSFGTINYLANGAASFPKERIEVFCAGRVLQLDNFRKLKGYGWPNFKKMNLWRQDKGQNNCSNEFVQSIKLEQCSPIPAEELFEVARVTIDIVKQLREQ